MCDGSYRGHLGRKAAKKWALRLAELDALMALQLAAGNTLQRAYRGRLGRLMADERCVAASIRARLSAHAAHSTQHTAHIT
jgi:hypothetical protein